MHLLPPPGARSKALAQNPMRPSLTMLEIIISVGDAICVVAIGENASARLMRDPVEALRFE